MSVSETFYNIPDFDSWYDGGLSMAKNIVRIFNNSKDFTLKTYDGQDDFYEEYLTKYDGFRAAFNGLAEEKGINVESYLIVLDNIYEALNVLRVRKVLNFAHFLAAYLQIFIYNDMIKGITGEGFLSVIGRGDITERSSVNEIIRTLDNYYNKYPYIVPFTTRTGAFGFNTYLYLYFNGLFPVAASIDPYPVHNGIFPGSVATMGHDYTHLSLLLNKVGRVTITRGIQAPKEILEYYESLRNIYVDIFNKKEALGGDTIKILVLFIFVFIHETIRKITCPNMDLGFGGIDEIQAIVRNKTYTPERYGLSTSIINDFIMNGDLNGSIEAFKFKGAVLGEAHNILCENFGLYL